jgi:hypothetical protein
MKTYGIASAVATALAGAALFSSTVRADLDPIVIKVRDGVKQLRNYADD